MEKFMTKKKIIFMIGAVLFVLAGCGNNTDIQKEVPASIGEEIPKESETDTDSADGALRAEMPEEPSAQENPNLPQFFVEMEDEYPRSVQIKEQTFEVSLRPFGQATFVSYAPDTWESDYADVVFLIERDGIILAQLPGAYEGNINTEFFNTVDAVSFLDYNADGYDDVLVILSYLRDDGKSTLHTVTRLYSGSEKGIFTYEKEISENASSALTKLTVSSVVDFIAHPEQKYQGSVHNKTGSADGNGFTQELLDKLEHFTSPATKGETGTFEDFDKILQADYIGLWYDPDMKEAIFIKEEGAYVYIPYLGLYGDQLYEWELIDRKQRGLCPELAIYFSGRESGPLAYYIGGITEDYFWCISQGQVFYKVDK